MNPWLIVGFVIAVCSAFGTGYWRGDTAGQAKVQQEWDKEKAAQYAEYAKGQAAAREKERALQASADTLRQEKDREIRDIAARNTALANSLRDRKARPAEGSSVSDASGAGSGGCTGKDLYRQDSEFLVRLGREADELAIALKQCYAQYESVRKTVK